MQFRILDKGRSGAIPMVIKVIKKMKLWWLVSVAAIGASAGPAWGVDHYWVSLGSFGELQGAEQVRDRAAATFYELSIVPSESPIGFVYRVVEGPMADRAGAETRLAQARAAGFVDAWLVIQDSATDLAGDYGAPSSAIDTDYANRYRLENSVSGQLLEDYTPSDTSSLSDTPSSEDYDEVSIGKEELVETAPAGYGLHQLERSGSSLPPVLSPSLPPGAAAESRLRELRPDADDDVEDDK